MIEVPPDNPDVIILYTMVCRLRKSDSEASVLRKAMQLNYMQYGTRGATLGLQGEEMNLCFSPKIAGLTNFVELQNIIEDFLLTASDLHRHLEAAKR